MSNSYGKYQMSLKIGPHMVNACADTPEEFMARIADLREAVKLMKAYELIQSVPTVQDKEKDDLPIYPTPEHNPDCKHEDTKEITGKSKYGEWKGEICKTCSKARFWKKPSKKNPEGSWGEWEFKAKK